MSCQPLGQHLANAALDLLRVARDFALSVLNQFCDVGVLFEAIAHTIVMEVETRRAQFREHGCGGDVVEIGTNTSGEQFALSDSWRKRLVFSCSFTSQAAERVDEDSSRQPSRG